jgi:TRAP-type C4-dicarboxylate transport system permease small subunit
MQETIASQESVHIVDEKEIYHPFLVNVSNWMSVLASITLAVMMLAVTIDVAGRDLFNWPLRGTVEIVGLLLVLASTWGLGLCQMQKTHLRVTLIFDLLPQKAQILLDIVALLICLFICFLVSWQMFALAGKYLGMTKGNVTTTLGLPFFPFMTILAWGFAWMCIILIVDLIKQFKEVFKG